MIPALLILLLVVAAAAALPAWPYSRQWGYGPLGLTAVVMLVLLAALLIGRGGCPARPEAGAPAQAGPRTFTL